MNPKSARLGIDHLLTPQGMQYTPRNQVFRVLGSFGVSLE
jgi:hypothetical protein